MAVAQAASVLTCALPWEGQAPISSNISALGLEAPGTYYHALLAALAKLLYSKIVFSYMFVFTFLSAFRPEGNLFLGLAQGHLESTSAMGGCSVRR